MFRALQTCVVLSLYVAMAAGQTTPVTEDERTVAVFVALCDNENQGIVPVPKAIGNGSDPEKNLYWGCSEGFLGVFGKSGNWVGGCRQPDDQTRVMRVYTARHTHQNIALTAFAYRGSEIKACLQDFEDALSEGKYDLVVYLGHNGLMDFSLPARTADSRRTKTPACVVLCCKSQKYFQDRLNALQAKPILLTTQLMYPGAFILDKVMEEWISGSGPKECRAAAGRSYAANQKLSQKAALGVFADLEK